MAKLNVKAQRGTSKGSSTNMLSRQRCNIPFGTYLRTANSVQTSDKITIGNCCWEVDEFHGPNKGLVIAVDPETEEQSFEKPDWIGEDHVISTSI